MFFKGKDKSYKTARGSVKNQLKFLLVLVCCQPNSSFGLTFVTLSDETLAVIANVNGLPVNYSGEEPQRTTLIHIKALECRPLQD